MDTVTSVIDGVDIKTFESFLRSQGAKKTPRTYKSILVGFARYLWLDGKKTFDTFTENDVMSFMATKNTPATANMVLSSVIAYVKFRISKIEPDNINLIIKETHRLSRLRTIRRKSNPKDMRAVRSITVDSLSELLERVSNKRCPTELHAGIMCLFYFGMRPIELEEYMITARIDFEDRWMEVPIAKRNGVKKWLPWCDEMTPYVFEWWLAINHGKKTPSKFNGEWLTRQLHMYVNSKPIGGIEITSRTGRITFETQMRKIGIPLHYIQFIMGHTTDAMSDVYTDLSMFEHELRDVMENKHYMVVGGVL